MSDIFQEVDEELRRDTALKLWKRYQGYAIAAAVVMVAKMMIVAVVPLLVKIPAVIVDLHMLVAIISVVVVGSVGVPAVAVRVANHPCGSGDGQKAKRAKNYCRRSSQ